MRKNVLRIMMASLVVALSASFVNAQVHVGDILCEGNRVVSSIGLDLSGNQAIGVVFYVDGTGQHGWAVSLQHEADSAWGPNCYNSPLPNRLTKGKAVADLDGYKNTGVILKNRTDHPAFNSVDYENGWYVPAIGQLKRLYDKLDVVNASLSSVGGEVFPSTDWECWSSTEYSVASAWYMDSAGEIHYKDVTFNGTKDSPRVVRGVRNF